MGRVDLISPDQIAPNAPLQVMVPSVANGRAMVFTSPEHKDEWVWHPPCDMPVGGIVDCHLDQLKLNSPTNRHRTLVVFLSEVGLAAAQKLVSTTQANVFKALNEHFKAHPSGIALLTVAS
ncbi:hypothetical protein GCM10028775_81270 [Catellatospora paridis]